MIFVLSLSYLRVLSDELFLKAELNKQIGLKTSKKGPGAPVIDIALKKCTNLPDRCHPLYQKTHRVTIAVNATFCR
jgi:hypothetical protein